MNEKAESLHKTSVARISELEKQVDILAENVWNKNVRPDGCITKGIKHKLIKVYAHLLYKTCPNRWTKEDDIRFLMDNAFKDGYMQAISDVLGDLKGNPPEKNSFASLIWEQSYKEKV